MHCQAALWGYVKLFHVFNESIPSLMIQKWTSQSLIPSHISHRKFQSSPVVYLLIFLPLTCFYVLSLPARAAVETRLQLSGSLEKLRREAGGAVCGG